VPDDELVGPVTVDYLAGNHFPMYRCSVVRDVGFFDRRLFFGFEEGEYGLRLRRAGCSLYVSGELCREGRVRHDELDLGGRMRTPDNRAAWRRYYSVRNITLLARRYGRVTAPFLVAAAGAAKGVLALTRSRRPVREVLLPLRGAGAGLMNRSGRTVDPGSAEKFG
jgi:rhamnopyranosyl-N-acetylglucosaminyl-diphospho-decaprenol beta-1,3/1,4-galactofuranosyltransferase